MAAPTITQTQYGLFKITKPYWHNTPDLLHHYGAPRLMPSTNMGLIDVVNDFSWTLTPLEARTETPRIELCEWTLKASALIGAINRYAYIAKSILQDAHGSPGSHGFHLGKLPYYGLYPASRTGFWYTMPYFADSYRKIANSWEASDALTQVPMAERIPYIGPILGEYAGLKGIETFAKQWSVNAGHEIPLGYTGNNRETLEIKFVLLNTTDVKDVQKNWEFIYLFSYQNLQNRKNYIVLDPPKFYSVKVEGVKYSPAMQVSDLTITNLGQIKHLKVNGKLQNVPEAWGVSISLTDLIPHSQNMLDAMRTEDFSSIETTQGKTFFELVGGDPRVHPPGQTRRGPPVTPPPPLTPPPPNPTPAPAPTPSPTPP